MLKRVLNISKICKMDITMCLSVISYLNVSNHGLDKLHDTSA